MVPPAEASTRASVRTIRNAALAAACAVTLTLVYVVHPTSNVGPSPIASAVEPSIEGPSGRGWTGHLADVAPASTAPTEAMTSASLVVSASQLPPVAPARAAGKRACEGAFCAVKVAAPPSRAPAGGATRVAAHASPKDQGWPVNISLFNHVLDTAALKQPFTYVGDKVADWFK